jgi:large subunit ribosomal protein L7/L12
MSNMTTDDLVKALGNLTAPQLVELTKTLEKEWGVQAVPQMGSIPGQVDVEPAKQEQTEFSVMLVSVPAAAKMNCVKAVRELTGLGLMESKTLVENVPKSVKEGATKEEAETLKEKLTAAGGVVELR